MIKKLIIICLLFPVSLFAQITDDFEDGDISDWTESNGGRWAASDISPLNGSFSLHHIYDNTEASNDQISIKLPTLDLSADTTTWRFKIKYDYNPSGGNSWSVFLAGNADAKEMYPGGAINGYLIGVNFTESDDTLRLYKITSGEEDVIVATSLNIDDDTNPSDTLAIEVIRFPNGDWEVKYNSDEDFNNLILIGDGSDNTFTTADYFGVYYLYTSSADRKLWIDDVDITGEIYFDNSSPEVDSLIVLSTNSLEIRFSETLDSTIAVNKSNYTVNKNIDIPDSIQINDYHNTVILFFAEDFQNGEQYTISIQNIEDKNGNVLIDTTINFLYFKPNTYDVVINELMVDPNPVIELPEYEYIELYNSTEFDIDLTDWSITVGSNTKTISSETIAAGEYVILCDDDAAEELQAFGKVITISSFPALTNSGQTIILRNEEGATISSVTYTEEWYQDDYKAEGGWSLEQIDPLNPCSGENNWIASESELGGTPGIVNSVNASNPDLDSPELKRVAIVDSKNIQLFFNESLDSISAVQTEIYSVDQGIGNPISINLNSPENKSIILEFENEFSSNTIYILEISGSIFDCAGNEISNNTAQFAIPLNVEVNDLVINELLFNPYPDGSDFIEIYNRSEKIIDLKEVFLGSYDYDEGEYVGIEQISKEGYLFFPKEYIVVTENTEIVNEQYYSSNIDGFIEISDLPSLNDDEGRVIIFDKTQTIIDDFEYDEDMQYPLLASNEGVSLERINFDRSTNDKTNWHSASEIVGFATPAYENSQFMESEDIKEKIQIEPEVFSPDNDGFEDFVNISFLLDEPGYVANIKIFDSKGRLIRYLSNNQLLGINAIITWDGLDEKNQKAPVGIYVVYIEFFDLDGNVKQYKETIVVAAKY